MNSFVFRVDDMDIEEYASSVKAFQKRISDVIDRMVEQMILADVYSSKEAFIFALKIV